ncbi:unnamed protein product [Gordionus sp. m RMFG-2023]
MVDKGEEHDVFEAAKILLHMSKGKVQPKFSPLRLANKDIGSLTPPANNLDKFLFKSPHLQPLINNDNNINMSMTKIKNFNQNCRFSINDGVNQDPYSVCPLSPESLIDINVTNNNKKISNKVTTKKYICPYSNCIRSYDKLIHLTSHYRTHTGETFNLLINHRCHLHIGYGCSSK